MTNFPGTPRVLHVHGSLAAENPQAQRCVRLIEAFGGRLRHTLVAADRDFAALDGIAKGISIDRRPSFPLLDGLPLPGRLQRIAREMVDYHLVLTYGRVGIGAALAHTSFSEVHTLPPLIHHEDGSDETVAQRRGMRSRWLRRLGLGKSAGLVVPTETMEYAALIDWQQPINRVKRIGDGVDISRFGDALKGEAIPRLVKRSGEFWIGCNARFDGSDCPHELLPALQSLDPAWHLVVVGVGPESEAFRSRVSNLSLENRVHLVPQIANMGTLARLSEIVVFAGGPEPLPWLAIAAMAAGKPLGGFDTQAGELSTCASAENAKFLVRPGHSLEMTAALRDLTGDDHLRCRIGKANRRKAMAERDEKVMIAAYRRLYASAMRRETI